MLKPFKKRHGFHSDAAQRMVEFHSQIVSRPSICIGGVRDGDYVESNVDSFYGYKEGDPREDFYVKHQVCGLSVYVWEKLSLDSALEMVFGEYSRFKKC